MKKFNFKLETVLSLRENVEKQWEAKLGKANGECQLIQNKIDGFKDEIKVSKSTSLDISQFHAKCLYEDRLNYQIGLEKKVLHEKEIERDKIKEHYLQKSIDRKIIDKLKDKSLKQYKKDSIKEDNLIIDEINSASKTRSAMFKGVV